MTNANPLTPEEVKEKGLTSMDIAEEKREQLKQMFPEVFTEDKIDFDQFKRVLGEWADPDKERFGLTWPGKAECMRIIQQPSVATLKPAREESVNFDETENLFIEGDNLEVLKLLQKSYFGKVKMIYIDPPYNTGKEFIYPDKYAETLDTYLEYTGQKDSEGRKFSTNTDSIGRYHSNWLNMMYPRLYLARNLLREDGVIFISIDDNEQANLKAMCDIIFGEENFVACIANTSNPKGRSDDKYVATAHEYILIYKKYELQFQGWEPEENITRRYNKIDNNGESYREIDLRKTGDNDRREDRPKMFYAFFWDEKKRQLTIGKDGETSPGYIKILPTREDGSDGRWRWGEATAKENVNKLYARHMPNRDTWSVFEMDYLKDRTGVKPTSSWNFKDVNSERGSEQFIGLGFDKEVFPKPKPLGTIQRLIKLATEPKSEDIILDFFAGSCTAAHATLLENRADGGNRKFILVQLPEANEEKTYAFKEGYKTIADIGKERIRRAAKKIQEEHAGQPDLKGSGELDLGFKVFKLSSSNFKIWEGDAEKIEDLGKQLEMHIDHINKASTPEDILYELLLKSGFPLTTKVEKIQLVGKEVFSIEGGAMLVCLDKDITQEVIDAMAEANPRRVICLDEGFRGNDQLKANAVQTFKSRAQETEIVFKTV